MILYPKFYCKKVTDITVEFLKDNNIKGLILDVDNTLIDFDRNLLPGVEKWCENIEQLDLENQNIAVVGDQIFTDVIGANRCNMFPILVEPIAKKDIWITALKRPIENLVIKKYLKKK